MDVVLEEVAPGHWREEAEQLARKYGHVSTDELCLALNNKEYGIDTFEANRIRNVLFLAGLEK